MPTRAVPAGDVPAGDVPGLVAHLFRRHAGQITAALARRLGAAHLDLVEDVVQDALLAALRTWPFRGVPDDPAAWLVRAARNRALDVVRRDAALRRVEGELLRWAPGAGGDRAPGAALTGAADDELALVFACCHPAVSREAGVALALTTAAGFGVGEIARAFLADERAVAQRLVRAKRRLRAAGVRVAVPESPAELAERLPAVLDVLYLAFTEGYAPGAGDQAVRRDLCAEALRLARLVAGHPATAGPVPHALAALLCFQGARLGARVGAAGEVVLLADQDRGRWDRGLVALGFGHLARAAAGDALTRYHLEAEIASYHAAAPTPEATNWDGVLAAYDALLALTASPVVAVHRAVAVGMARGPAAALDALDAAAGAPALARYPWLYATRAHWRARAGRPADAAADYRAALALTRADALRAFLRDRLAELPAAGGGAPRPVSRAAPPP